jgi:hypothetical protein
VFTILLFHASSFSSTSEKLVSVLTIVGSDKLCADEILHLIKSATPGPWAQKENKILQSIDREKAQILPTMSNGFDQ